MYKDYGSDDIWRVSWALCLLLSTATWAKAEDTKQLLAEADRLAWLGNSDKAGPLYAKAEESFSSAGDTRNALCAKVGRIHAQMQANSLPELSSELKSIIESPVIQSDLHLKLKVLVAKGDIDMEFSPDFSPGEKSGLGQLRPLPQSRDEVITAAEILGTRGTFLFGEEANEAAFKSQPLASFDILHFAVHAIADTTYPDRAALVLARDPSSREDGLLQEREITFLPLKADLVVLSACDTGVGRLREEEGISNLARSFLFAGARAVVASLWPTADNTTSILMTRFYTGLAGATMKPWHFNKPRYPFSKSLDSGLPLIKRPCGSPSFQSASQTTAAKAIPKGCDRMRGDMSVSWKTSEVGLVGAAEPESRLGIIVMGPISCRLMNVQYATCRTRSWFGQPGKLIGGSTI